MLNKINVKKHDKYRALMSDVLPYETPMIFSNHGLYNFISIFKNLKSTEQNLVKKLLISKEVGASKPYTLFVSKPNGDSRELHIPHPSHQIAMSKFLYNNSELILSLCSISNFSIRTPNGVTSSFKLFSSKSFRNLVNIDNLSLHIYLSKIHLKLLHGQDFQMRYY